MWTWIRSAIVPGLILVVPVLLWALFCWGAIAGVKAVAIAPEEIEAGTRLFEQWAWPIGTVLILALSYHLMREWIRRRAIDRAKDRIGRGRCPSCDYDTSGIVGRCPECGRILSGHGVVHATGGVVVPPPDNAAISTFLSSPRRTLTQRKQVQMGNEPGSEKTPPEASEPSSPKNSDMPPTRLGEREIDYDEITTDGMLAVMRRLNQERREQQAKQQGEKPE